MDPNLTALDAQFATMDAYTEPGADADAGAVPAWMVQIGSVARETAVVAPELPPEHVAADGDALDGAIFAALVSP